MSMAGEGLLAGVTILNDIGLANALVGKVPYVVFRLCLTDHDPQPPIQGNLSDEQRGYDWYYQTSGFPVYNLTRQLDKRIIIQLANEQNHPRDGWFYIGAMKAARDDKRKVVIFNDSVGNPGDGHEVNGRFVSETWQHRIDCGCLRLCKQLGNYVGYHGYGKPDTYPGSAIGDDGAWKWFGGRVLAEYEVTPEDSRPDILYTECGTFRADYMGVEFTVADMQGYQTRFANNPYVKAFMYWTAGGRGDAIFNRSCLDPALDAIAAMIRKQRA